MVFPPTAPWWSAGLATMPQGRYRAFRWTASGGMQDLGTLGGYGAGLMVFPPTAPWWSAWLTTPQGRACLSLAEWCHARPRHAGRRLVAGLMVFPPTAPWWSAGLTTPQGRGVPFAGRMVSCKASARWAAIESVAYGVSADGAVVVGWAQNAAGQWSCLSLDGVVSCKTSARWAALGAEAYGVSADGAVVVGWA
jgi:probable HAF family extracellular repeat protein